MIRKISSYAALLFFAMVVLTGCSKKTAIDAGQFEEIMSQEGFLTENLSDFVDSDEAEMIIMAMDEDETCQLVFYILADSDDAISIFQNIKAEFETFKGNSYTDSSVSLKSHGSYKLTSGGYYYVVSRIENTIVYSVAESDSKTVINDVLEKLGY